MPDAIVGLFSASLQTGVADELYDSTEYRFTLPESARKYVFLRLTAGTGKGRGAVCNSHSPDSTHLIESKSSYNLKESNHRLWVGILTQDCDLSIVLRPFR